MRELEPQKQAKSTSNKGKKRMGKPADQLYTCFKEHVPASDWKAIGEKKMSGLIKNFYAWLEGRKKGQPKIRVYNVDEKEHGWKSGNTVIEIINDDRPFLIDSIAAELAHHNFLIAYLFHPVVDVHRSLDGKIEFVDNDIEEARLRGDVESCIHIQLEQYLPEDACKFLEKHLMEVVSDVTLATSDWHDMLGILREMIREVSEPTQKKNKAFREEAVDFLDYVYNNNFTLLGYRQYCFDSSGKGPVKVSIKKGSEKGLLKDGRYPFDEALKIREYEMLSKAKEPVIVSKWIDQYSTVHRRVPFDVINVKILDKNGKLVGQHVLIGLFTSSTYSCRTVEVPLVRRKVKETLEHAKFGHDSHDRKALEHILEKYPRDELFQVPVKELVNVSLGILRLQERQRIALFVRQDPLERYISCLVYIPRDIYDTRFRRNVETILEARMRGVCTNYYVTVDDSPFARGLFTILVEPGSIPNFDVDAIEQEIIEIGKSWPEKLSHALIETYGKEEGAVYSHEYANAFPVSYQDVFGVNGAVKDILRIENLLNHPESEITIDFFKVAGPEGEEYHLKVYHQDEPVRLSDILTVLENMGLESVAEMPFEVLAGRVNRKKVWVHDFLVAPNQTVNFNIEDIKDTFEDAFLNIWTNEAENDELNALVLQAGLSSREVLIVRSFTSYLKQARFPYSRRYIETVLSEHADIVRDLIDLFKAKNDPSLSEKKRKADAKKFSTRVMDKLHDVEKLDHDRILRGYHTLIEHTLRTNYYQRMPDGHYRPCLSLKLNSKEIDFVPRPRPYVEIFVYSSRVEGVHLRGGEIARGGLRWSDRHDDFRTEILSLAKAQQVKNAVIVPVGAKGGFIVKQPPLEGGREAFQEEGIRCYKLFVQSLLDLTDNNELGKIIPPDNTVRHDGDDPYLVVAADKGTATFSDIANGLSDEAGFWLDDAFASGGSAGYDHKGMGITARGAWESVKRHFREMGKNTQKEDFTVIGVGDMGGDVFGNGMLLSKHIRLQGAFNHLHIFCDPDPDAASSFKERNRLFKARGGWDKYDAAKLSKGGRVYERSAKSIKLTPEIQACYGFTRKEVTPDELIREMLRAEVELLWFGGIGTYIRHSAESDADADDRNNDNIRIDATEVRASVIGEGANLGMTQRSRIEFAENGGRLNTDFIDNSAGVDCSDHEVNIKILLNAVMRDKKHKMSRKVRDNLLEKMTDEVAELVLDDNYQQNQALSVAVDRASGQLPLYASLIRDWEKEGVLDRKLEDLPNEETIGRMLQDRRGLTRPELSVILSYAKITLFQDILASDLPDEPGMEEWLNVYFPQPLLKYKKEILDHRLRREIIATLLSNALVNRMGPVFIKSRAGKTGASGVEITKAFLVMIRVFDVPKLWNDIEALDNKVPSSLQVKALNEIYTLLKHTITWMLRRPRTMGTVEEEVQYLSKGMTEISGLIRDFLPHYARNRIMTRQESFVAQGMPKALASEISGIRLLDATPDIIEIGNRCKSKLKNIASVYFGIGQALRLDWLRQQCWTMQTDNHWQARALSGLIDEFYSYQEQLTSQIVSQKGKQTKPLQKWEELNATKLEHIRHLISEIDRSPVMDVSMLTLAAQAIRQFVKN